MQERQPVCWVAENMFNRQSRTADKGWSSSLGVGRGASDSQYKNWPCNETDACACTSRLVRPKEWRTDMRFGTWNVRSL